MGISKVLLSCAVTLPLVCSAEMFCPETVYEEYYKPSGQTTDVDELFTQAHAIFGGRLRCHVAHNYNSYGENYRYRTEEGTYKGLNYRIFYTDGGGEVQGLATNTLEYTKDKYGTNWSTKCKKDEMDDTHWCALSRGGLSVGIWKDGSYFVTVGSQHYPRSKIAVRVDKNEPIVASADTGFSDAQPLQIIEQFMSGNSVLTRYQEWPYERNKDNSFDLFGFKEAWEILNTLYEAAGSDPS